MTLLDQAPDGASTLQNHPITPKIQWVARNVDAPAKPSHKSSHFSNLLVEILDEILSRLPASTLQECKCVCKPWKALISNGDFIHKHLHRSANDTSFAHHRLIVSPCNDGLYLDLYSVYSLYYEPYACALEFDFPFGKFGAVNEIIGTCNGLVCVATRTKEVLVLNPAVKICKFLSRGVIYRGEFSDMVYGFGYDVSVDDYKVVAVLVNEFKFEAYVNTLRSNYWRKIQDFPIGGPMYEPGTYVTGTLNWKAREDDVSDTVRCIVSLNLEEEIFRDIPLPDCGDVYEERSNLGVLGGYLCLCIPGDFYAALWVMKECWTNLYTISYLAELDSNITTPLCISKNGEILFDVEDAQGPIVLYNSRAHTLRFPEIRFGSSLYHNNAKLYVESLVSPLAEHNCRNSLLE